MDVQDFVLELDAIGEGDAARAGNKALRLARLRAAGLPAPGGFVIVDGAFKTDGELRDAAVEPVLAAFHALLGEAGVLAVRSSGAAEDARGASFAGQFKTILGVGDEAGFRRAVVEVRRSFSGAAAYRDGASARWSMPGDSGAAARKDPRGPSDPPSGHKPGGGAPAGPGEGGAGLAATGGGVLVQPLVRSAAAGVVFGCDPVGGDPGTIVINAGWGLGEGVVSGEILPELIRVRRDGLRVEGRWSGGQSLEQVHEPGPAAGASQDGGIGCYQVVSRPVPEDRLGKPVLGAKDVRRVAQLALDSEKLFGGPQDVEWALDPDGGLFFLQARPVTAAGVGGKGTWTSANSGEALPDPVSPLTWSLLTPMIEEGRREAFHALGVEDISGDYMRLFLGRPYFNLDYFRAFLADIPGLSEDLFDALIFTEKVDSGRVKLFTPTLHPRYLKILSVCGKFAWRARSMMDRFIPRLDRLLAERVPRDIATHTDAEILKLIAWLGRLVKEGFMLHVLGTAMAGMSYLLLRRMLSQWLPEEPDPAGGLLTGASGVSSADQGYALAALARTAAEFPEVAALLKERHDGGAIDDLSRLRGGRTFLDGLRGFLEDYGHMGNGEADLLHPRWIEDPSGVLAAVAGYLHSGEAGAETRSLDRLRSRREAEAARVARLLGRGPIAGMRRVLFKAVWRLAVRYAPYRENLRFATLRAFLPLRRAFTELGRRLEKRGLIGGADDVFYLELAELVQAIEGGGEGFDLGERIDARRARRRADLAVTPPPFFVGERPAWATPRQDGDVLTGIGASGGVVSGQARILRSPDEGSRLRRGDILVAPFADPAWTPLLLLAGGVVLEVGGVLSHAAVVAREYGVPCVVGVPMATRIIKDGDPLTVDGTRGAVIQG